MTLGDLRSPLASPDRVAWRPFPLHSCPVERARGPVGQGYAVAGVGPPEIEFDGATLAAGHRVLLDQISVRIPAGTTVAVMGPSGSGKTLLARLLAGELRTDAGHILVDGGPLWRDVPARLAPAVGVCGLLLGASRSYDRFIDRSRSVLDNLSGVLARASGEPAGDPGRVRERAREWCLDTVLDRCADELDSITRHRLCLAQAFVADPSLAIVDDPNWAVDINHVDAEIEAIRRWRGRVGGTLLLTTHSLMLARALADQVLVLRAGMVVAAGPTDEVLRDVVDDETFERRFGGRLSVRESDVERLRALGTDEVRWVGDYLDMQRPMSRRAGSHGRRPRPAGRPSTLVTVRRQPPA